MNSASSSQFVKTLAKDLGFMACGIAKAARLDEDAKRLESWLGKGFQGQMGYMERNFDLRVDPTKLVPGAASVITLLYNYFPQEKQDADVPKVARYAFGEDYHDVLRQKLNAFLFRLREKFGAVEGRGFVDSAPVLERAWAVKSGLGWVGKNGNLIQKQSGSYFFISTLITDLKLESDPSFSTDHCGSCTRCIDACPTQAIVAPQLIDASRCISYLTIELKDSIMPQGLEKRDDNWMFGCDVCQEVCPWNRFSKTHTEPAFQPSEAVLHFSFEQWKNIGEEAFKKQFKNSPFSRTKWKGMLRNITAIE